MNPHALALIGCVTIAGLAFDFVNGFHDAANSIATVVATRVLTPRRAVMWASLFNIAALFVFGSGVARTVGAGLVDPAAVTPVVILCGLVGATGWGLVTWLKGLPTSSSHALIGAYAGAAVTFNLARRGWRHAASPLILSGWLKVIAFIVIAPLLGLLLARLVSFLLDLAQRHLRLPPDAPAYGRLQLASSAFLSLMHGGNDAQKTAGIVAGAMTAGGVLPSFSVPAWLLALSYLMMGLGTLFGGWRIVRTMGARLTKLDPQSGVCAESGAALSILLATAFALPVSTTHVTTGAILGAGAAREGGRVRWRTARRIGFGWLITIPAACLMGGAVMAAVIGAERLISRS